MQDAGGKAFDDPATASRISILERFMPTFEPVLLARIDKPDSTSLAGYRADGGYERCRRR